MVLSGIEKTFSTAKTKVFILGSFIFDALYDRYPKEYLMNEGVNG